MLNKQFLTLIVASLFITGCSLPVKNKQTNLQSNITLTQDNAVNIINVPNDVLHINGQINVPKQDEAGTQTATIQQLYFSAMGEQCILVSTAINAQQRLYCQQQANSWIEMPVIANLKSKPTE